MNNAQMDRPPIEVGFSSLSLAVVLALMMLLGFFACKNISYPLLWNDESETAMSAQQVLNFGYPKVHDGKNTVFIPDNPLWLGYKASCDANISIPWGNYYYGAIGVLLARNTNDIYQKTGLIRLPFVIAALLGLMIFAYAMRGFFSTPVSFRLFLAAFLVLELLSVNLLVHLREARYYSLVILTTGCLFYIISAFHFHHKYSRSKYIALLTGVFIIAFNINLIAYVTMCFTMGLFLFFSYLNYHTRRLKFLSPLSLKDTLVLATPVLLSALLVSPELIFFETFRTAQLADLYYHNSPGKFADHFKDIFHILFTLELLPALLIIKIIRTGFGYTINSCNAGLNDRTKRLKAMSFFMSLFFMVYILTTARMPFIFTRYFIVLQPVLVLILLTDVLILLEYVALLPVKKAAFRSSILAMTSCICVTDIAIKDNHISDYLYQISHQYQGPLDYYIPAIKERFPHTENIIIATNYEELSYAYYLNCKVILGYQNHFQSFDDTAWHKDSPDVIILRPGWPQDNKPYQYYLQHACYQKILFPVQNRQVNNVADLYFYLKHGFKTQTAEDENDKACMYVKVNS